MSTLYADQKYFLTILTVKENIKLYIFEVDLLYKLIYPNYSHLHFFNFFFFFNDTATTEIYTLSLHDALPISAWSSCRWVNAVNAPQTCTSSNRQGGSHLTTLTVSRCLTPKCTASQVTSSPAFKRPVVTPPTARSCVLAVDCVWTSTSRIRSKHLSIGAAIDVSRRMTGTASLLLTPYAPLCPSRGDVPSEDARCFTSPAPM